MCKQKQTLSTYIYSWGNAMQQIQYVRPGVIRLFESHCSSPEKITMLTQVKYYVSKTISWNVSFNIGIVSGFF